MKFKVVGVSWDEEERKERRLSSLKQDDNL
jgi:hypothetical protein